MARTARLLLAASCVGAVLLVATTVGFGATHRFVVSFWRDVVGVEGDLVYTLTNVVRKLFHVPAYALVGGLLFVALRGVAQRTLAAFALTMLVALADEVIQALNPRRSGSVADLFIDAAGALLGIWIASRWADRHRGRRKGPPSPD